MSMENLVPLFENTVGQQQKKAAVVVGRFNPPHAGHYAVIDAVKKYIRENKNLGLNIVPIVVIVEGKETSKDKSKNPLTADERIMFMNGSGNANGVKFIKADSAFSAFEEVRKAGYEPIAIAAGSDRADNYLELLDKYFKTKDGGSIKHYSIKLDRDAGASDFGGLDKLDKVAALDDVLQYTDDEIPTEMISGSLARHAVNKDELEKFAIITGLKNTPKMAKLMFNKIKTAMSKQHKEDENGTA